MAETLVLTTEKRQGRGSRKARHLRAEEKVPGVIYGHKEETVSVSLSAHDLSQAIRHGARVVDLKTDKGVETAQIVELQYDHLGKEILHVDFKRVSRDERIKIDVRVELRGIAPGVTAGGVLDQPLHTLHIECLAVSIPDSIRVNIGELQIDGAIHVKDVKAPEGVKILNDPDAIVVHVTAPVAEPEPTAAAAEAAPGAAEPEVIGRPKAEEEAEEAK
jgi:large subunit ribosomal protein L25